MQKYKTFNKYHYKLEKKREKGGNLIFFSYFCSANFDLSGSNEFYFAITG